MIKLYEKSLTVEKTQQKYTYYQFIYYLLTITDNNFDDEFEGKNKDLDTLVNLIKDNYIKNLHKLKIKASISKHVESSFICFQFLDDFKLEDIPDDVIINMLDNVENRL